MKKYLSGVLILLLFSPILFSQQNSPREEVSGRVIVSYRLNRLQRLASNQLAVWIEDGEGRYVDTLHVTRFTARGGYQTRADALSLWVDTVARAKLSEAVIDSLSAATQQAGTHELIWDCSDFYGNQVPA